MIFYDINLEVDGKVPRANSTSLIKSLTSNNTIPSSKENVKENSEKLSDRTPEQLDTDYMQAFKEGKKYSQREKFAEYNKPITLDDIKVLRSIGRKSINAFTVEDVEAAQKWAYKFYQQLGTKSPFFRRWFGDWRAYDIEPANIVSFTYGEQGVINRFTRSVHNEEKSEIHGMNFSNWLK